MEKSLKQIDSIIEKLEAETGAEPIKVDPSDPWFADNLVKSKNVYKVKCNACGYYYTIPFETECPICKFKPGKKHPPYFYLDLEGIQKRATPVNSKKEEKPESSTRPPQEKKEKQPQQQKEKKQKQPKAQPAPVNPEVVQNEAFSLCNFRIARLTNSHKHPDADKLIIADADIGDGQILTLVTGLIPHYQPPELENRLVCVICNLKPKKMVGVEGHVMLLAATDTPTGRCQILQPPPNSQPGDRIFPEDFPLLKNREALPAPEAESDDDKEKRLLQLYAGGTGVESAEVPKRQFERVVAGFKILGEKPLFYGKPLTTARGYITAIGVADNSEFH
ncbi:putative methionyl-tRNA synthetase [Monocercomonoides exilis]|uniref:putative methionyl-tRNA synthetase n=1 Tax=Monocercomonoides exilis TaxID=2049356 RepID=UPI00355A1E4F|nr:putative methionyl-tRNA synthetase [Monocercomonoides exilis]|eukprot:MONOS_4999.1-p1 / transcript=MONOS_4999.1 / gene=MONOS_4999 / organism=Monocercomonoides_exilis_PA203 / gene_product=methionyl-tRNA synthetase / transcript_product=methionyl-tRNA synthetase / location=Mono_scaffold00140:84874-85958(-) / protein_length=334 / sequence_SO=supercontig / SO=protein_coding / is_pseudo=false